MQPAHRPLNPMGGARFVSRWLPITRVLQRVWLAGPCVVTLCLPRTVVAQSRPGPTQRNAVAANLSPISPPAAFVPCARAGAFRFAATVLRRDSVTTRMIARTPLAAVVRVDTVLPGTPRAIRPLGDRVITLILSDTSDTAAVRPGDRSLFLASGVLFDTSVVLRAQCRIGLGGPIRLASPAATSVLALTRKLAQADSIAHRADLLARTQLAAVVAAVRVTGIDSSLRFAYPGEHNPQWRIAITSVLASIKPVGGAPNANDVLRFYFPGTEDAMYGSVRVRPYDEMLVFLYRLSDLVPSLRTGLDSTVALVLLDANHIRPASDSGLAKPQ